MVCVRLGRPVTVARGDCVAGAVGALDSLGAADGLPESDGHGLSEAEAEAEDVKDGRADLVDVRVGIDVRVANADLVISRVRVDEAEGPKLFIVGVEILDLVARLLIEGLLLADVDPDSVPVAVVEAEAALVVDPVGVCGADSVLDGVVAGLAVAAELCVAGAVAAGESEACAV